MTYVLDNADDRELQRLRYLEAFWDPGTIGHLTDLGVVSGWRCLEIGGGAGAITRWLSERVGPVGSVVATDLDPRHLHQLGLANVEVRRHDIANDELETDYFDCAHLRFVAEHLADPDAALRSVVRAVQPGGVVLVEAPDWIAAASSPPSDVVDAANHAALAFLTDHGYDPSCGRAIPDVLRKAGCVDVEALGRWVISPDLYDRFGNLGFRIGMEELGPRLVDAGYITQARVEEAIAWLDQRGNKWLPWLAVAAWGRKPA